MTMRGMIEINMDYVVICGTRVNRPEGMARSYWLTYWEARVV